VQPEKKDRTSVDGGKFEDEVQVILKSSMSI
jgi:hypothetical protein